jgi:hypothetical protein
MLTTFKRGDLLEIARLCFPRNLVPLQRSIQRFCNALLVKIRASVDCMGMTSMDRASPDPHSHLFTVRLWLEDLGDDQVEWRGSVQHVISGELSYFRDWSTLIDFLITMLSNRGSRERIPPTSRGQH